MEQGCSQKVWLAWLQGSAGGQEK